MKGNILIISIGILLILVIAGGYFFYTALSKEEVSDNNVVPIIETPVNTIEVKPKFSSSSNTANQSKTNSANNSSIRIQNSLTNELGEIIFNQLNGKITLLIKAETYAPYSFEFDVIQTNEVLIKLTKGSGIKGHLTFAKDVVSGYVFLQPNVPDSIPIGKDGNFAINDLTPGEYSISFK